MRQPGKDFDTKFEESGFKEETFTNSNEPGLTSVLTERDGAKQKTDETIEANRASEAVRIDDA